MRVYKNVFHYSYHECTGHQVVSVHYKKMVPILQLPQDSPLHSLLLISYCSATSS